MGENSSLPQPRGFFAEYLGNGLTDLHQTWSLLTLFRPTIFLPFKGPMKRTLNTGDILLRIDGLQK